VTSVAEHHRRRFMRRGPVGGHQPHGYMPHKNAVETAEYARAVARRIQPQATLPGWVEHKLSRSRSDLGDVKHYLDYEAEHGDRYDHGHTGAPPRPRVPPRAAQLVARRVVPGVSRISAEPVQRQFLRATSRDYAPCECPGSSGAERGSVPWGERMVNARCGQWTDRMAEWAVKNKCPGPYTGGPQAAEPADPRIAVHIDDLEVNVALGGDEPCCSSCASGGQCEGGDHGHDHHGHDDAGAPVGRVFRMRHYHPSQKWVWDGHRHVLNPWYQGGAMHRRLHGG